MSLNSLPKVTRLRYVKTKTPELIPEYLASLGVRVQLYGPPVWTTKGWYLWFVPDDTGEDIPSIDLDSI